MGYSSLFRIDDQVAWITGAGRNIGRELALGFSAFGAKVAISDIREEDLQKTAEIIRKEGGDVLEIPCDISEESSVFETVNKIRKTFGRVDIFMGNAGVYKQALIGDLSAVEFQRLLNVNLLGTFLCVRTVTDDMIQQGGGRIVLTASVAGITGSGVGASHYAASKGGVIAFVRSAARELGRHRIRINAIAPGLIDTDMIADVHEQAREVYIKSLPLGRMGKPRDLVGGAIFLASSASEYVTGQVFNICGGYLMA